MPDPTAPVTGRRYRLSLEFGAADDRQAHRLGMAWAGTCAAEYNTCNPVVTPLAPVTAEDLRARMVEDDMDLRDMIGPRLEAAQVRDADGVAALAVDVISPVLERLRAELAEAKTGRERYAVATGNWTASAIEQRERAETAETDLAEMQAIATERSEACARAEAERDALTAAVERVRVVRERVAQANGATLDRRRVPEASNAAPESNEDAQEETVSVTVDDLILRNRIVTRLRAERDALRARLTGVAIHANRLKTWINDDKASITIAGSILGDLFAALEAPESPSPAPSPVSAATEATGGTGGAEDA